MSSTAICYSTFISEVLKEKLKQEKVIIVENPMSIRDMVIIIIYKSV